MLPCRLKVLMGSLESWSNLLRPCASELVNFNQNRNMRVWKTWPNNWIPFDWKKPEPQPGFFESGDRKEGLDKFDLDQIKPNLKNLEILKNAPESVKKLYTLRFARRRELKILQNSLYESNLPIRRRLLDKNEYERKVIRLTVAIRHIRDVIRNESQNSAGHKNLVSRYINKRYKFLVELYKIDRESCQMLCDKLEIDFKVPLPYYWPYPFLERKRTIRETCETYCKDIKKKKLDEYKEILNQEDQICRGKARKLEWIEKTMAEHKITEDMLQDSKPPIHLAAKYVYLE
ncbi:uncharacterized protein LOC128397412 [Panonychus citri]|uniref:uncharacterized protein LOC128397412 n=1 Tax=Panonychus citri TaxID=50023 RepID=UPI0023079510|nr:uncharacterized protein LOC128397412 [Panonychus citri]